MLEAALAAHQKALEANTAALSAFLAHVGSTKSTPATTAKTPPTPPAKQEQKAPEAPPAGALDYTKDVRPVAVRLIDKDRAKMVEILTKHGVKLATELKADKLPAFLADVKAALGEK
jgi:hypothetical protein